MLFVFGDAGIFQHSPSFPHSRAPLAGGPAAPSPTGCRFAPFLTTDNFKAIFQQKEKPCYQLREKQACSEINISFVSKQFTTPLVNLITARSFCIETTP